MKNKESKSDWKRETAIKDLLKGVVYHQPENNIEFAIQRKLNTQLEERKISRNRRKKIWWLFSVFLFLGCICGFVLINLYSLDREFSQPHIDDYTLELLMLLASSVALVFCIDLWRKTEKINTGVSQ